MFSKFLCFYISTLWTFALFTSATQSSTSKSGSHTCVIGAGYSGLATARYLKQYGLNFTVYEASKDIGGTWRYDPRVGTDEYGVPIFTSQYKHLRINTPRQTMEFNGFPFSEHAPSYLSGNCFFNYIKSFVTKFGLMKYVKLHSFVTLVKLEDDHWDLTYNDVKSKINHTVHCDFVVIASGQYVTPVIPTFDSQEDFTGRILHSHDYRDPEDYKGLNVLLVGIGLSGLDLSVELVNVVNKLVHSYHKDYKRPAYPDNYIRKPDIKHFESKGVVFEDGSYEKVDVVILCTGYNYVHPFIHENAELRTTNSSILPLHRNIVNIKHPTMAFIGVIQMVLTRVLDAQAQYVASLVAGKFQLPSEKEMIKLSSSNIFTLDGNKDMNKYFSNITEEAGIDQVAPVLVKILESNGAALFEDTFNYRDFDYEVIDDYNFKRWYNPRNETCEFEDKLMKLNKVL